MAMILLACPRPLLAFLGLMTLAACASSPRDLELAGLDLSSPAVIARLTQGLDQKDRAAFATYALLHWPESKAYCGRPMFADGARPATVGEAIERTRAFESALASKRAAERAPLPAFEQQAAYKKELVDEFDRLTLERDMLETSAIGAAERERQMKAIDRELAANRAARDKLLGVPAI